MPFGGRERVRHWWRLFRGLWLVVGGLYALVGLLTFVRDNVLPPLARERWDTWELARLLPHWPLAWWLVGGLLIVLGGVLEASFREDRKLRNSLSGGAEGVMSETDKLWLAIKGLRSDNERMAASLESNAKAEEKLQEAREHVKSQREVLGAISYTGTGRLTFKGESPVVRVSTAPPVIGDVWVLKSFGADDHPGVSIFRVKDDAVWFKPEGVPATVKPSEMQVSSFVQHYRRKRRT